MRLLVVTQYFWPENFRINDLVAELVRRGHQVTVLTGVPNYPGGAVFEGFRKDPHSYSYYEGAKLVRVPMISRGTGALRLALNYLSFAISASVIGVWRLRRCKFDAIFAYQLSPVTVGIPAIVMRTVKHAPLAFWVLDLWPETLYAIGVIRSPTVLRAVGKLVAYICKRCDLILAQSQSFIPKLQKYVADASRVVYFPSWAEPVFDAPQVVPASEVLLQLGSFNVMFAGNIGDAQDFPAILAAANRLRAHLHIRWLILGDGRKARWVADEITRLQLQDCVVMLGQHPLERMPSFFKHANALLVSLKDAPIFAMTIPGKLQSYLAAGIPVVAMLNGEGADVVSRAGAGLTCAAGDDAGLAAAVLALSQMTIEERESIGRRALQTSKNEFDRTKLIDRLEGWIETMVVDHKVHGQRGRHS